MKKKTSIIINIVLFVGLLFVLLKEDYISRVFNKITPSEQHHEYENNWQYKQELSLYDYYNSEAKIVMLGNSITYRANWNELLNRTDIINRGIGDDTTKGFLSRMDYVTNSQPELCFIMGGINDIRHGIAPDSIRNNLKEITNQLKNKDIKPIILSILYVASNYPNYKAINETVGETNTKIKAYCTKNAIDYIDLNNVLSEDELLKKEYSFDGIHLTGSAYNKWKEIILPVIEQNISPLE